MPWASLLFGGEGSPMVCSIPTIDPTKKATFSGGLSNSLTLCFITTFSGADTRSRTRDLLITSQLLYQLSYVGASRFLENMIVSLLGSTINKKSCWQWLGYQDSNLGMPLPKSGALPLGDTPAVWWPETESNRRHGDFQSPALPTELSGRCQRCVLN